MLDPEEALLETIIHIGVLSADIVMVDAWDGQVSRIKNPDGSSQRLTESEKTSLAVTTAVRHLVNVGLLIVPAAAVDILEQGVPVVARP